MTFFIRDILVIVCPALLSGSVGFFCVRPMGKGHFYRDSFFLLDRRFSKFSPDKGSGGIYISFPQWGHSLSSNSSKRFFLLCGLGPFSQEVSANLNKASLNSFDISVVTVMLFMSLWGIYCSIPLILIL